MGGGVKSVTQLLSGSGAFQESGLALCGLVEWDGLLGILAGPISFEDSLNR